MLGFSRQPAGRPGRNAEGREAEDRALRDLDVWRARGGGLWRRQELVRLKAENVLGNRFGHQWRLQQNWRDVPESGVRPLLRMPFTAPDDVEKISVKDVTPLLEAAGIRLGGTFDVLPVTIHETPATYPCETKPEDNWLYAAFKGMVELKRRLEFEGKRCHDFATIGTGSGLDMIGAWHIFHPGRWYVTDINRDALQTAEENLENNVKLEDLHWWDTRRNFLHGSLAEPLIETGAKLDVLYANLPNIPARHVEMDGSIASATFIDRGLVGEVPKEYDRYLLGTQYMTLMQARQCVKPGGSVVVALGGRVPYALVKKMFEECGYKMEDLYGRMKVQTQPDDVIGGYADNETRNGVDFRFYDLSLQPFDSGELEFAEGVSCLQREEDCAHHAITAREALRRHAMGHRIGHPVWILRGVLQ